MSFLDALTGRLPGLMAAGFAGNNVAQQERYRREQAAIQQARQQQEFEAEMRRKAIEEGLLRSRAERQPILDAREDRLFQNQLDDRDYINSRRPQQEQATGLSLDKLKLEVAQAQWNLDNAETPAERRRAERALAAVRAAASRAPETDGLTTSQQMQLIGDARQNLDNTQETFTQIKGRRPKPTDFQDRLGGMDSAATAAYNAAVQGFQADSTSYANQLKADRSRYDALVAGLLAPGAASPAPAAPSAAPAPPGPSTDPRLLQVQREAQQVVAEIMADPTMSAEQKQARVGAVGERLKAFVRQLGGAPQ